MKAIERIPLFKDAHISARSIAVLFLIVSIALSIYLRADNAATDGFSAEIGNVAASVAAGHGFSGVFAPDSGDTAWCPPLYVLIYAWIFIIFGIKTVPAFWALMVLRSFLLACTLYLLLKIDYKEKINKYKIFLLPIFVGFTFLVIYRTGPKDAMFAVFLSVLVLYAIQRVLKFGFNGNRIILYTLAILLPFSNISMSIGMFLFFAMVGLGIIRASSDTRLSIETLVLIVLMLSSFTLWGVRNTVVLGKFIPFKSNLWFELYISNVKDGDGLLKFSNYKVYHPLVNKSVREKYTASGEVLFLDQYQAESVNYLKNSTSHFVKNISNRLINIFIYAEAENDIELAEVSNFEKEDVTLLTTEGLLLDEYWICLEMASTEFKQVISNLNLIGDQDVIFNDWANKASISSQRVNNIKNLKEFLKGMLTSIVPFIAILICLLNSETRKNNIFISAIILFLLSIGPYLIISWIPRYQSFQLGFFTVFVFMAFSVLFDYVKKGSRLNF